MYLGVNLKFLRKQHGFSQEYIADKFGYKNPSTIQKWESGVSEPPVKVVEELARIYGVTMDDMMKINLETGNSNQDYLNLPVLGTIAAGLPLLADQNIESYFTIDNSVDATFILKVKGTSMIGAGILDGDLAFIRKQPTVENGEIAAVMIDEEATLKRVYFENGVVRLVSENPEFKTKVFNHGDVKIIGKLVAVLDLM